MDASLDTSLRLAITKISDILLDNKITQDEKGNEIPVNLKIPDYQRPYKWTARNVIQLLNDILDAKNENKEVYRVGTLILHKEKKEEEKEEYNIVDGQQRIITFSLLLRAFDDNNEINFLDQPLADNPYNRRNVPNNYRAIENHIKNFSKEEKELGEYIKNNCELIVVITEDISEAFQFFDSQNARGKKLYPHDLLKAYHLREMRDMDITETEKVVKGWEDLNQEKLAALFSDYLYRLKEWIKGNRAWELNEHNIYKFKGITRKDNFPYAKFYKGAYAYAEMVNRSAIPFVSGTRNLQPFQLDTPMIAGKPFFDYAKHYFEILKDIQDNSKYEGYFINDNKIVKTLDIGKYKNGVGNKITRLLFDTAILLYVDRFCPTERPAKIDLDMLDKFVVFAFVWAYSLRAQYSHLGWTSAQNYIMSNDKTNSFNLYKTINEADSPVSLLSELSDKLYPLNDDEIKANKDGIKPNKDGIYQNYLGLFKKYKFWEPQNGK